MLIPTPQGVKLLRDWGPDRIGCAYQQPKPQPGEGMLKVQELLLGKPLAVLPGPGEAWDMDAIHWRH